MQITGAGPAPQRQFDFDTKIEKQGTENLQSGAQAATAQATAAAEETTTTQSAPVQASSESSESGSDGGSASRERGIGGRVDVSV